MTASKLRLVLLGDGDHVNIQRWNAGLQTAGAETIVLSLAERHTHSDSHLVRLPTIRPLKRLNYLTAAPFVRRFLRRWQPDVLLAYYVTGYGTLGMLSGFHPVVQVTSGSDVLLAPHNPAMRQLVRRNLSSADLVTAWTPHMADAIQALGISPHRLYVLPPGIPSADFRAHRCAPPSTGDALRLIVTRSLKAYYRIDTLIEAARLLKEQGVSFTLTIAGEGPQRRDLEALIGQYRLEQQVTLAGFLPNDQLPPVLQQHNIYISLVPSDGVSASLLEAMSVGLLPIVPDHPANRYWIEEGRNGVLLSSLTPDHVAAALTRASTAVDLRQRAWQQNPSIVSERGDLYHNADRFVARFQQLVHRQDA